MMHWRKWLKWVYRRHTVGIDPLITIELSKSALLHNFHTFQSEYSKYAVIPVLKSNAYGHGLVEVASLLDRENIAFFAVDSLYEAALLREHGICSRILILGYVRPEEIAVCRWKDILFTIVDIEHAHAIGKALVVPQRFHLKIDTGLRRQGVWWGDVSDIVGVAKQYSMLTIDGAYSHFADSDNEDDTFVREQRNRWKTTVDYLRAQFPEAQSFHIANTAGARFSAEATENGIRVGRGLYGIDSTPKSRQKFDLRPVLTMKTLITSIKKVESGESIGYARSHVAEKAMTLAILPVGYYEGVDRRLSHKGSVLIHGAVCSIVGRVSMNMTIVDITAIADVKVGDEAIIVSSNAAHANSIEALASIADALPHELLCYIPAHLRRAIVE